MRFSPFTILASRLVCLFLSTLAYTSIASAQQSVLQSLDAQEEKKLHAPYVFKVASFAKDEGAYGSGALILLISNDTKTAIINLNGVRTELQAMQANVSPTCITGATRQQVYAKDQLRLTVKLTLRAGEEACWADGLVSIRTDKHTRRYLVKGVSGL